MDSSPCFEFQNSNFRQKPIGSHYILFILDNKLDFVRLTFALFENPSPLNSNLDDLNQNDLLFDNEINGFRTIIFVFKQTI